MTTALASPMADAGPTAPLVSVIIAAYNCAPYVGIAIESALTQTVKDLEVVVVDDASTDETLAIARGYEQTGRVRVLSNAANVGPSHSRNRAMQAARGKWVVQLDGDDWMVPHRVARLVELAENARADVVADDLLVVDDATLSPISTRFMDKGITWRSARRINAEELIHHDLGSIKPLLRRAFLDKHAMAYPNGIRYGEDFLFLLKALLRGASFWVLPEPMYCLRRGNTGSLTTQKHDLYRQTEAVTLELLEDQEIQAEQHITSALKARLAYLRQLSALANVTTHVTGGHVLKAVATLVRDPGAALVLAQRLPFMLSKRRRRLMNRQHRLNFSRPRLLGPAAFHSPPQDLGHE